MLNCLYFRTNRRNQYRISDQTKHTHIYKETNKNTKDAAQPVFYWSSFLNSAKQRSTTEISEKIKKRFYGPQIYAKTKPFSDKMYILCRQTKFAWKPLKVAHTRIVNWGEYYPGGGSSRQEKNQGEGERKVKAEVTQPFIFPSYFSSPVSHTSLLFFLLSDWLPGC